ncbi:MAG: dienelactone hydrolase family protein [Verrucomicrobiota bacterium]
MTILDQEFVDLPTNHGPMRCYIVRPAGEGKYPGVILFSEIFQVTGPIRRTASQIAGQGFVVIVPEIYHEFLSPGTVLAYDQAGADKGNELKIAKELSSYDDDARACIDFLQKSPHCTGKIGSMGMCLGGHLSFRCAMNPEILAGVCFYATDIHKRALGKGMNDNSLDRIPEIKGEILMIWGRQDPHIPGEGRQIVYQALNAANTNFQWLEFNGAHAFLRDEGNRFNPALASLCYQQAFELFRRKLN